MKKVTSLFLALAFVVATGTSVVVMTSATAKTGKKTIKVKNTTTFKVDQIFLSPHDENHWGEDILDPNEILTPGEVVTVSIDCGKWDVKLVAEDKSTCELESVDICSAAQWNIVADCNK